LYLAYVHNLLKRLIDDYSFIHSSASYCTTQSKKWKNTPSVVGKKSLMDKLAIVGDMDGAMKEMSTAKGGFQLI